MEEKILKKICPHCGKEFVSLYEKQLDYNFQAHLISCEEKNKEKEKNGN